MCIYAYTYMTTIVTNYPYATQHLCWNINPGLSGTYG